MLRAAGPFRAPTKEVNDMALLDLQGLEAPDGGGH